MTSIRSHIAEETKVTIQILNATVAVTITKTLYPAATTSTTAATATAGRTWDSNRGGVRSTPVTDIIYARSWPALDNITSCHHIRVVFDVVAARLKVAPNVLRIDDPIAARRLNCGRSITGWYEELI